MNRTGRNRNKPVDLYALYEEAVQDPPSDVRFYSKIFREIHGSDAKRLREDFCGTFRLCCEWVKFRRENSAIGVDLDAHPLSYGRTRHLRKLSAHQKKRLTLLRRNVLEVQRPQVDIVLACNFSYYVFKKRRELRNYFRAAFRSLKSKGLFIVDTTGGSEAYEPHSEWRFHKKRNGRHKFTYFWDQKTYNPITQESEFAIHFKLPDGTRLRDAFLYDWRLWSIPELREVMREAGFPATLVYWEGDDNRSGGGNGIFQRVEKADGCASWLAYVIGKKG
ncbi:MAG: class I SAM-dependent methyltransferase [Acidobacteria bacterium]|nr:class I SAM-dependent methyltransferase [Acidobacteriota bacterium]